MLLRIPHRIDLKRNGSKRGICSSPKLTCTESPRRGEKKNMSCVKQDTEMIVKPILSNEGHGFFCVLFFLTAGLEWDRRALASYPAQQE